MVRYDRFHTKRDVSNTRFSGSPTAFHLIRAHSPLSSSACSLSLSLRKIYVKRRGRTLTICPRILSRTLQLGCINTCQECPGRPPTGRTHRCDQSTVRDTTPGTQRPPLPLVSHRICLMRHRAFRFIFARARGKQGNFIK